MGKNRNKGLCIFFKKDITVVKNEWENNNENYFLSVRINDEFDLMCVWAGYPYIKSYYQFQKLNIERYNDKAIIVGDFNTNAKWDLKYKEKNFAKAVDELNKKNIYSIYHYLNNKNYGEEDINTFFQQKKLN